MQSNPFSPPASLQPPRRVLLLLRRPHVAARRLQCTAEHLVPRSDGGRESATNIVAACAHCNHTRHRQKRPPEPPQYRAQVRRRVALGGWHHPWIFDRGLLRSSGHKVDRPGRAQDLQFAVLQTLPLASTPKEVVDHERRHKVKLGSRAHGLNSN